MSTSPRPLLGALLAAAALAAGTAGQSADQSALPIVSYAKLGEMVRGHAGQVVVVYFWASY